MPTGKLLDTINSQFGHFDFLYRKFQFHKYISIK